MSNNINLSPIEMKKEKISLSNNKRSDWKKFGKSVFKNLIYTILISIVGANAVYLSLSDLDKLLPSDPNKLPYSPVEVESNTSYKKKIQQAVKNGVKTAQHLFNNRKQLLREGKDFLSRQVKNSQTGGGDVSEEINDTAKRIKLMCDGLKDNILKTQDTSSNFDKFYVQNGFSKVGFPYNYITKDKPGIMSVFKNMLGESSKYSYSTGRNLFKIFLKFFSGFDDIGLNALFILTLPIIIILFLYQIPFIIGFVTTFLSFLGSFFKLMPEKYGWSVTILIAIFLGSVFLFLDMFWALSIGIIQMFRFLSTLFFLPILIDTKNVLKIIGCRSPIIIIIFTLLTMLSAYSNLDSTESTVFIIVLIILTAAILKNISKIMGNTTS
jgi:hypothetical protein